ncbi:MAG: sulfite exporter TauE/SafE family protein, partial [Acidobacteriota bacterium]|nr:sulfite exporter TauE/SafE family protein [Acidobacteriota bacterium]
LRSAFLINAGLSKEAFVGTAAACSVLVDVSRLLVYGTSFFFGHFATIAEGGGLALLIVSTLSAFAGSYVGARLVKKVTLVAVQRVVGAFLLLFAIAMGAGLL